MKAPVNLDLYTDGEAMRVLLQQLLPGFADGRLRIDALQIDGVRRSTSQQRNPVPLSLCYELQVRDTALARTGTQRLVGQVFRPGLAAEAFAAHDQAHLRAPAFGEALVHLPSLNLLLWALPNDPGLPQLPELLDAQRAVAAMPEGVRARVRRIELLRHVPQRRVNLRYTLDGPVPRVVYAKSFHDERAAVIHARFSHFWQAAQHDARAPLVPEPLGHDARTRSVWQAAAQGRPMSALWQTDEVPALLARVAHALAVLHAAPVALAAPSAPRTVGHWLAETRRRETKIGRIDAALAARAERVAQTIAAQAPRVAQRSLGLIHGDCHPDQFWLCDGRVVLFDFDEFTLGDPMEDLAEFVLKLEQGGLAPALAAQLCEHYAQAAPQRFDAHALAWHVAIQSLLQVSRAFIYQQPGWQQDVHVRLAATEQRVRALA